MSFLRFGERHRLGHEELDAQHEALFAQVNRLHDLAASLHGRQALAGQLAELREETVLHFSREEELMRRVAYPGFPEHRRLHDILTRQLQDLELRHREGSLALSLPVMTYLKDWLVHHIAAEDRRLVEFLAGDRG